MAQGRPPGTEPPVPPTLLGRLLRAEATLRRHRSRVGVAVAVMVAALAVADARVWPGISLAFGYAVPVTVAAYVFGTHVGVAVSLLAVVLRRVFAGRSYDLWWLYAGSALMLTEYLMLAVGVGMLGRAVRRLVRNTDLLKRLNELARGLTTVLEPTVVLRQGVEASVRLTGADGGLIATATDAGWQTTAIFRRGRWHEESLVSWPDVSDSQTTTAFWPTGVAFHETTLQQLGMRTQLAVPLIARPPQALVVFRATRRPFQAPMREVLELFALHLAAAFTAADRYTTAVQATHDKARMLAHVAHELAVPLHVILGASDLLAARVDDLGKGCVERLQRQTRLLVGMTANLLEFSRLEGAKPVVRRERVHVPDLYEQVRELAISLLGDKDTCVEVHVEPSAEWIESDPEKLREILTNLATNAVKYTPSGRVELRAARENGQVTLTVEDTGVGIPLAEQARVFEPFYRVARGPRCAGVGLGLSLAQELAHLLGTRIALQSREGQGSTFSLALPVLPEGTREGAGPGRP